MKARAAALVYNTPDLVAKLRAQVPGVFIVDNGSTVDIPDADMRITENVGFVRGWNLAMQSAGLRAADYVWMLNSDVEGISDGMLWQLVAHSLALDVAFITPAFNSPHAAFHPVKEYAEATRPRAVSWIDWTCPLVRRRTWFSLGGFDERSSGYFADVDLCKLARGYAHTFAVCDWLTVNHIGSVTAKRMGHVWDSSDEWLRDKWGVDSWSDLV